MPPPIDLVEFLNARRLVEIVCMERQTSKTSVGGVDGFGIPGH